MHAPTGSQRGWSTHRCGHALLLFETTFNMLGVEVELIELAMNMRYYMQIEQCRSYTSLLVA